MPSITPLPGTCAPDAVDAWHATVVRAHRHDLPGVPEPHRAETAARMRVPAPRSEQVLLRSAAPAFAGVAAVRLFTDPANREVARLCRLTVDPEHRRRGHGVALLAAVRATCEAAGRRTVTALVDADGPGAAFGRAHGFHLALPLTGYVLDLPDVVPPADAAAPGAGPDQAAELPPGHTLTTWDGPVPPRHAAAFAEVRRAMAQAPTGRRAERPPDWDVAAVRELATVCRRRGQSLRTVAIIAPDGAVAAYTEVVLPTSDAPRARQSDTGVAPAHRGRGLGRAVQWHMVRLLRAHHPELRQLVAVVADENAPARAVAAALGYRVERRLGLFEARVEDLPAAPGTAGRAG
ncbi:GNAT family N-acetyltransferase [Allostreptomyces psammosilenae]|uniref:GNAT superfamily N-acetyltransferase n=1 Tax=Allostreptomyces psammosilenae TaxID=1892865 RepID=A0A853A2Q3_9ACTN|nr:GNAT family N-acetyltransferase [Allostreptomyces psammosilenae]NYI04792.1 GNAT superfamily N-acetyltransferase [Allostreptomyces psammosilenae]